MLKLVATSLTWIFFDAKNLTFFNSCVISTETELPDILTKIKSNIVGLNETYIKIINIID